MAGDTARHRPGTPCWAILVTPDPGRTGPFYAGLFGWSVPATDAGFATVTSGHGEVAGVLALPPDAAHAGAASRWLIYLATEDIGDSLGRVRAAGGEIVAPAFDVGHLGRMAMAADGMGAQFGLWEAGTHPGAVVTGQVGSLTWAELRTRSRASAAGFYEAVFGWRCSRASPAPRSTSPVCSTRFRWPGWSNWARRTGEARPSGCRTSR